MEEEVSSRMQLKLLSSPLVAWVSLFRDEGETAPEEDSGLTYKDLYQGNFLRNVLKQIYSRNVDDNIVTRGARLDEATQRLTNWNLIMKTIKVFYRDELQQVVTVKLPDILRIYRDPDDESSCADIRTTILLILGCAVQCERKEFFVQQILKRLNSEQQHAIKDCITELKDRTIEFTGSSSSEHITDTEHTEHVISLETQVESLGITGKALYYHLSRTLEERDIYIEEAARATVESEIYLSQLDEFRGQSVTSPTSPEKHHIVVELAEEKAKVRRLRMEIEERTDQTEDLRAETIELKSIVNKLREENKTLMQDARSARSYRDELDIVKEKALKVDKLERQLQSYKDRMHELDFYKARVDELREDNKILIETKVMLEDQLATSQQRVDTIIDLENELMNKRKEAEDWNHQRELDHKTIQDMHERITKLQCEKKSTLNESANLEEELALARGVNGTYSVNGLASSELSQSLREQLSDSTNAEVLRLELENQRLQKLLAEQKEQFTLENSTHLLELEKENRRLASKVQKLQDTTTRSGQDYIELENEKQEYHRQVTELKNAMDTVKESSERQVQELERENEQLNSTIETLRQRNEENIDMRVKDVERENKKMAETVKEAHQKLSKLDYEHRTLQKAHGRLQDQVERVEQVEEEKDKVERENSELAKQIATLQLTVEKYEEVEQALSDKEVETKKLQKQLDNLKEKLEMSQQQSKDNITLTVENQRLNKALTTSHNALSRVAELESELEDKEKEVEQVRKSIQQYESDRVKLNELEVKLYTSDSENHKLNKSIELYTKKLEAKNADYEALQKENKELEATIQSLRLSIRKLERLTEDNKNLEDLNSSLTQEKDSKDKEIKKLKQTLELKESTIDEYSEKVLSLEKDQKSLRRSGEKWRQASMRVREHEKEANDLVQKSMMDKKTITALREELVQEKIKVQQITNDLDQLTAELHKIGIDKDKLEADVTAADEMRLKALQDLMQDSHRESLTIKDEKIKALEQHLEESKNLNATLHRQLDTMQKEYQSFLERKQNEPTTSTTTINVQPSPGKQQSSSISQLVIKKTPAQQVQVQQIESEHYLAVQRELSKAQKQLATLQSENAGLKSMSSYAEQRCKKLDTQIGAMKGEKNSLQTQNAQLQVENTTLKSQSTSLRKQNQRQQQQLTKLQADFEETAISHQELNETYENLVADHEQLQQLNEQLSSEYEALISEHGMLKSQYKQLKEQLGEMDRSKDNLAREKAAIEEMRQSIHKERLSVQLDESFTSSQDMKRLAEENQMVQKQTDKIRGEYRDLLSEYRTVKTEYNQLKLKHTELKGDMADCRDQLNRLDIHNAKLTNTCEALERQNAKLEEENKQLIFQLQALLQQNQELLSQTLESSEHFREEENIYRDQVAHLRRAKEKLEEKIMDQYKTYERAGGKKKGLGSVLVKKAKGFITKRSRDPGRRQTIAGINYVDGSQSACTQASSDSCGLCNSHKSTSNQDEMGEPSSAQFRPVTADSATKGSENRPLSKKDLTQSQIDLVYGVDNVEDTRSLSGLSIGSKGSSKGSEETSVGPSDVTMSKNNKVHGDRRSQVRLRKSRMKAQSIENLFDTGGQSASDRTFDNTSEHASAFHPPRNTRLTSAPDIRPEAGQPPLLYNSTFNHQLTTDHRQIAVSTSALNVPVSVGPLKEVSLTIPIDELTADETGSRTSDDIVSSHNGSNVVSPNNSSRPDSVNSFNRSHRSADGYQKLRSDKRSSAGEQKRQMWLIGSGVDSDDDARSHSTRDSDDQFPTKDCDDNFPTKDVGMRSTESMKSSSSSNSLFYTPSRRSNSNNSTATLSADDYTEQASSTTRTRAEHQKRAMRGDYNIASPKPDLVMGTEASPRGLVYYDQPPPRTAANIHGPSPSTSTPKYGHEYPLHTASSNHRGNMYASLDSRLDRNVNDRKPLYGSRPETPTHHARLVQTTASSPGLSNGIPSRPQQQQGVRLSLPVVKNTQSADEEKPKWLEYGCV